MTRTASKDPSSRAELGSPDDLGIPTTRFYQLLWQGGLAALPGAGDLPDYLKPERIQKSGSAAFLAELRAASEEGAEGEVGGFEGGSLLSAEKLFYWLEDRPDWRVADDNRSLVAAFVLEDSEAAVKFAAYLAGIAQAAKALPAFCVCLNTVWVVLTNPALGGLTVKELTLAERIHDMTY